MGYSTYFTGAVRITPRPDDELIVNMNVWLSMRHHMGLAQPSYQELLTHRVWEPDGPQIPDPVIVLAETRKGLSAKNKDSIPNALLSTCVWYEPLPEKGTYCRDYNYPEIPQASLWSNMKIYPSDDCAYLAWDEGEKAYAMDVWFAILVDMLSRKGFKCEGTVRAQGEDYEDKWSVIVRNNETKVAQNHRYKPTWQDELTTIREAFEW